MATLYTTGTINQPDAGSVGLSMAEKIRDDIIANSAWRLVEEFTPTGGVIRWYVFKCLGSANGLGQDFFVVMGRTLATGELRFALCEGYDPATHTMSGIAMQFNSSSGNYPYDTFGRRQDTIVLGTAAFSSTTNLAPTYTSWIPTGTATKYWVIVSEDQLSVAFNGTPNGYVHLGAYIPLSTVPISLPLLIYPTTPGSGIGGITRNPVVAGQTNAAAALVFHQAQALGFMGRMDMPDPLQGGFRSVSEIGLSVANISSNTAQALYGYALGKLKRIRQINSIGLPANLAFGDAWVLDGRLWVQYAPINTMLFDTGIPA